MHDVGDQLDQRLLLKPQRLPQQGRGVSGHVGDRWHNSERARAGELARKDAPTCGLKDKLGDGPERVRSQGWDAAVVINDERVVLGLLRTAELDKDPDLPVEEAMRPGPSTFRPFVSAEEMADFMVGHQLVSSPLTTSDGRLVGLLLQEDLAARRSEL